jgi:hypothetical protein
MDALTGKLTVSMKMGNAIEVGFLKSGKKVAEWQPFELPAFHQCS